MMSFYADVEGPRMIAITHRLPHAFPHGSNPTRAGGSSAAHQPRSEAPVRQQGVDAADRSCTDPSIVDIALGLLIDRFEQGVVVTDLSARILFLNCAMHTLVRAGLLHIEGGHLRGTTPGDSSTLRSIITGCVAGGGSSARLMSENGQLLVAACAIPAAAGLIAKSGVLLRFTDPASVRPMDKSVLQRLFGFTPAEATLAADVLAGYDLAAIAARRGITSNTARAHLRRIFEKTGTRRQAELMRLLLLCPQLIAVRQHMLSDQS